MVSDLSEQRTDPTSAAWAQSLVLLWSRNQFSSYLQKHILYRSLYSYTPKLFRHCLSVCVSRDLLRISSPALKWGRLSSNLHNKQENQYQWLALSLLNNVSIDTVQEEVHIFYCNPCSGDKQVLVLLFLPPGHLFPAKSVVARKEPLPERCLPYT